MKLKLWHYLLIILIVGVTHEVIKLITGTDEASFDMRNGIVYKKSEAVPGPITNAIGKNSLVSTEFNKTTGSTEHKLNEVTAEFEACFEAKLTGDDSMLNMENIVAILKPLLGEPVGVSEDWSNTILFNSQGEERRVRLELEAVGDEGVQRIMKLYGVDEEGLPVPIEIPAEHQLNPSDALVASYQSDGQLQMQESGIRASYKNGHEIFAIERNKKIAEVEFSYDNRYLTCRDVGKEKLDCQCVK